MEVGISKAIDIKDNNQTCWRWTFLISNIFLISVTIAFMITGANVVSMNFYESSIEWI